MLLTIEKLIYGGDGLARLPPDNSQSDDGGRGKAVFVPFVLAGEQIEASLGQEKPGFVRAHAKAIISSSPNRATPACPYFSQCGGCQYQHAIYEHQLEIKKDILRENLRRLAKFELPGEINFHASPPWNYRNRSRLQVQANPNFAAGYFRFGSHQLLPIEYCPISSPLINRGIAALWQVGRSSSSCEGIREIEFFANADDTRMRVDLHCAEDAKRANIRVWAEELSSRMPEIVGVAAFRESGDGMHKSPLSIGAPELTYQTRNHSFRVSAGSFFQTNRFLTDELIDLVTAGRSGDLALDFYAGVGLFSTALACNFRHVISVESSQTAASDLAYNLPRNGEAIRCATGQYLSPLASGSARADASGHYAESHGEKGRVGKGKLPQQHLHKPDLIVVDPPRSGLGDRVARALASVHAPRVTYVSCDPATLARDLVPLQAAGYGIEEVHLVDLFPQTFHLETVVHLTL